MSIRSKKDLEIELSKLKSFDAPSAALEQYPLSSSIAADWIWQLALRGEVAGKIILDAGCGPGILGMGLLLMGARKVYFVDKEEKAMRICQENYAFIAKEYDVGKVEFILNDIKLFDGEVDVVVQNPPFGTKQEHADKVFLENAFSCANLIYSMHKTTTAVFVEAIARDNEFVITHRWRYDLPIKAAFAFHEKPVRFIDVTVWRMEKIFMRKI